MDRRITLCLLALVACSRSPGVVPVQTAEPLAPSTTLAVAASVAPAPAGSAAAPLHTAPMDAGTGPDGAPDMPKAPAARGQRSEPPPGMRPVPGGKFVMGADEGGEKDERPAHEVTVKDFLLDETEVTNTAYRRCVDAKVCRAQRKAPPPGMRELVEELYLPDHPVVGVSWFDAKTYCEWLGKRLPTEAEWERAARDGDGRRYVWGNDTPDPGRHGVFANRSRGTEPVGKYPQGVGPYGHLDLAGNVWEWIADEYDPYAYRRATAAQGIPGSCDEIQKAQDELRKTGKQGFTGSNPIPTECEHVLRGGAYNYPGPGLRVTNRVHHPANWRITVAGLRCARDP